MGRKRRENQAPNHRSQPSSTYQAPITWEEGWQCFCERRIEEESRKRRMPSHQRNLLCFQAAKTQAYACVPKAQKKSMLKENQDSDLKEIIFFIYPACSFGFYLNRIYMNCSSHSSCTDTATVTSVLTFQQKKQNLIYAFWASSVEWTALINFTFELQGRS